MGGEATIRQGDELSVEPFLTATGFVAGDKQDRLALRIECEGGAPFAVCRFEPQLFHIGVLRSLERVRVWTTKLRTIVGQQLGDGEQSVLDIMLQREKLRLERVFEFNFPSHI